jgi:hypothetical protein
MIGRFKEIFQMPAVGQYSINKATSRGHDLTRHLNKSHQETFKFHPQDVAPCRRSHCYQTVSGLQILGQSRNNHISPIRNQTIRWHSQSVDSTLELTDDVFLVAAITGEQDYFLWSHLAIVCNVKEEPHIIEQPSLSLFDREVFLNHSYPIRFFAMGRTIVEFGDLFALQPC